MLTLAPGRQDQGHAAVAHDGGARDVRHRTAVRLQVLHHHLLLAEQLVHQRSNPHPVGLDDHHDRVLARTTRAAHVEDLLQGHHRQELLAHPDHLRLPAERAQLAGRELERFHHRGQRQHITLVADAHRHAVHDGQRQRQTHAHAHALAFGRLDLDHAAERGDVLLDHVHADAAAGHVADLFGGGKAGREDQAPDLGVAQAVGGVQAA
jgi:hypothetical protein